MILFLDLGARMLNDTELTSVNGCYSHGQNGDNCTTMARTACWRNGVWSGSRAVIARPVIAFVDDEKWGSE